jgi:repressor LexA
MTPPTKKQTTLLSFIENFTTTHNYSPSYREIMRALNLKSVSAVHEHIENCVAAGHLKKIPKSPRALQIIKTPPTETQKLFRQKIQDLSQSPAHDQSIKTLEKAAKILGINLQP